MDKKKVFHTELCDILGIEYPIMLAGMGGLAGEGSCSKPKIVAAVSNAGGFGVLGATGLPLDDLRAEIKEIKSMTDKPFGVDLLLPSGIKGAPGMDVSIEDVKAKYLPKENVDAVEKLREEFGISKAKRTERMPFTEEYAKKQMEVMLEEKVPLFASALGIPEWVVPLAHEGGMKVLGLAGNVKTAMRHKNAGADLIVAQGHEAGGHTGRIGTLALIPQVVDAVAPTPVLAAGGIGDGRGIVAGLALGAIGVWIGTAFLFATEANVPDGHRKLMIEGGEEDTKISRFYTGKTVRMINNPLAEAWEKMDIPPLPMPFQPLLIEDITEGMIQDKRLDLMCQPAGQVIGLIKESKSAKQILDDMVDEVVDIVGKSFPSRIKIQ